MYEQLIGDQFYEEEVQDLLFQGFPKGLNTKLRAPLIANDELAECLNFFFRPGGKLITRPPVVAVTDTPLTGAPHDRKTATFTSGKAIISSDKDGRVYYDSGDTPTLISTVEGTPFLFPYKGAMLICDGSYLKYCVDTSEIKIAYDAGDDGIQYSNWDLDDTDLIDTGGVAVSTKIGARFTSASWTASYTMPITKVQFKIKATTANATCAVRLRTTAGVLMAEKALIGTIDQSAAQYYSVSFSASDITTEMSPGTEYDCLLEGVDFELHCTTVGSSGTLYNNGTNDPLKDPIIKIHPGLPPKADYVGLSGRSSSSRLFLKNPDEPGRAYYSNLSYLDWSTENGGGWVGVFDDDKNSFPIGGFGFLYGVFYIYGSEEGPYLGTLTGESPAQYKITPSFQHAVATQETLINTNDDLWNASSSGIDHLKGVQESGDIRAHSITERVSDKFDSYWGSTAFAGYDPTYGTYLIQLPGSDTVLIGFTKLPFSEPGEAQRVGYPWAELSFPFTPTYFSQTEDTFVIGADDKYFYKFALTGVKDKLTMAPTFLMKSASVVMPGTTVDIMQFQIFAAALGGAEIKLDILVNGKSETAARTETISLPMSDTVTVADLAGILVSDWLSAIGSDGAPLYFEDTNINCFEVQVRIYDVMLSGSPLNFDGFRLAVDEVNK